VNLTEQDLRCRLRSLEGTLAKSQRRVADLEALWVVRAWTALQRGWRSLHGEDDGRDLCEQIEAAQWVPVRNLAAVRRMGKR
jgi:hypothetical protein